MNLLARAKISLIKAALAVTGLIAILAAAVVFADPLGLGVQQDFILYRWYGIARRPAIMNLLGTLAAVWTLVLVAAMIASREIARTALRSLMVGVFLVVLAEFGAQFYYNVFNPRTADIMNIELYYYSPRVVHTVRPGAEVRLGQTDAVLFGYFGAQADCAKDGMVFKVNSDGFRAPEFSTFGPKAENEVRIVIVGGSVAMSWNVGEACTLDAQLHERLASRYPGKKIVIINISSGAWKSFQELASVQVHGLKLEPDLIVAFDGTNDIVHSMYMDVLLAYAENYNQSAFHHFYEKYHYPIRYLLNAMALPRLIRGFSSGVRSAVVPAGQAGEFRTTRTESAAPIRAEDPGIGRVATRVESFPLDLEGIRKRTDFSPYAEHVANVYTRNLGIMARSAEFVGAKLLVFVAPSIFLRKTPTEAEKKTFWNGNDRGANFTTYTHLISVEKLKEMSQTLPNLYVEDANKFTQSAEKLVFTDCCHMPSYGYSLVAQGLADTIVRYELLD